ncbi:MAG: SMC-Scp complex subunit ScpB [Clostridia bacterium]|nr:SMC-Scp complex subunit ScpB [Clostridia bacterium]
MNEQTAQNGQIDQIKNIEGAIEAILYAAGYPVKYTKIAEVLGLDLRNTKTLIEHMAKDFNSEKSKRGINLLVFDETCQFCTKEQYAPYIREALGIKRGGNLSASSMEVLAIVAYNQPLTRTFVDQVRGVDSSYAMNSLIDKGLIEACGRLDAPGRPMLYVTTEKFLRVFGLQSLSELPATETLLPPKEDIPMVTEEDGADMTDTESGTVSEQEAIDADA